MDPGQPDTELRRAALARVRELSVRYDDIIPLHALREGFVCDGERVSFGSFQDGIHRPRQCRGPAALSLITAPPKVNRERPYEDDFDEDRAVFSYHYRRPAKDTAAARLAAAADNRALRAAFELAVPVIYFHGVAPSQYQAIAPTFVVADDPAAEVVRMQAALPVADIGEAGPVSDAPTRAYATREARFRLHQSRFRVNVLAAYRGQCAVCRLREASLIQAAHIVADRDPRGHAVVVNGIALCAIHHLAYDRNVMGIDPDGVVHIAHRLLEEVDGPMLKVGLQGFHGQPLGLPRRHRDRPDPARLATRFQHFSAVA